jgi:glycosyltransferase involved in cell wall biosynthesis
MKRPELTVVIPVYNEENRIGPTLEESLHYLKTKKISAEILIVDDGSKDRTRAVVEKIEKRAKGWIVIHFLEHGVNKGKGAAVRTGALAAKGEVILFMDADNATPLSEYEKFKPVLKSGVEVVIGSRAVDRSQVKIPQPIYRQALGRVANLLIQILVVWGIWDTQCGFKAFSRKAASRIFPLQTIHRFGFDFELLFIAHRLGFTIKEISVQWFNSPYSKVKLGDYLHTLIELFTIRVNALKGLYDRK